LASEPRRANAERRILLVEDDHAIRESFAALLQSEGYVVNTADNGFDALELLDQNPGRLPDLIILDLMMPGINGWEFRARQLDDPHLAEIPVLVMTGIPNPEQHQMLKPVGFLKKPLDVDEALRRIGELC
jgi:CheY-like chemotaxis protein